MTTNGSHATPSGNPEDFLEKTVEFRDGSVFERLDPITDLRKDPGEGRILYLCRRIPPHANLDNNHKTPKDDELLVMKIKAQWPGPQNLMYEGPSPETSSELEALQLFRDNDTTHVPHLLTWKKSTQPHEGIYPGGYVIYIVMTRLPGTTLWDIGYWGMKEAERDFIMKLFMIKLRELRQLRIKPYDCALRNVMYDRESKQVSIVDFEHFEDSDEAITDEREEFQKWGLMSRPPPRTWFLEWGLKGQ